MGNPHRTRHARGKRRIMNPYDQQTLLDMHLEHQSLDAADIKAPAVTPSLTPEDLEQLLPIKSRQYLAHARKEIYSAWSEQSALHELHALQLCSVQPAPDIKKLLLVFKTPAPLDQKTEEMMTEGLDQALVSIRLELGRSSTRKRVPHLTYLILPPLNEMEVDDGSGQ